MVNRSGSGSLSSAPLQTLSSSLGNFIITVHDRGLKVTWSLHQLLPTDHFSHLLLIISPNCSAPETLNSSLGPQTFNLPLSHCACPSFSPHLQTPAALSPKQTAPLSFVISAPSQHFKFLCPLLLQKLCFANPNLWVDPSICPPMSLLPGCKVQLQKTIYPCALEPL